MQPRKRRPVAIFDFDGTLADTWRDIATALNATLRDAGLPEVQGADARFWISNGALKLLERAVPAGLRDRIPELYEIFGEHYDRCCLDTTETYAGITDCLDALSHFALAVLSNKPVRFLDRCVQGLGLKDYFEIVLGGDALPAPKPDARAIEQMLERMAIEPEGLWMIGDSAVDVETGQAAGAVTVGCTWGLRGREELRRAGPDHLVDSPREIPAILQAG